MNVKKALAVLALGTAALTLAGCTSAEVVNNNITRDAENFKVERRIVFVNGITDQYLLTVEGRCNLEDQGNQLEVICKTGDDEFKKSFLGLSDNVTYFAEQIEPITEDPWHYKVVFRPETVIPDLEIHTDGNGSED